ncbi:DUF397 domain-containing protein [Nocardiopsis sediminis]|uniref:DUF397 domain-containing protein n=1 Tax=Nocardiopsis sediminis TaxID=1778267 RepID=A0ABV8FS66_9ACTN
MTLRTEFRKSSHSGQGINCVEVARIPAAAVPGRSRPGGCGPTCASALAGAVIRDSEHPDLGDLAFPDAEWRAFLAELVRVPVPARGRCGGG